MSTINVEVTLDICRCASCHIPFAIPDYMKSRLRQTHETFYCPSGHNNYYPQDSDADKLRKELKRKEQELADQVSMRLTTESELQKVARKLKRVHNGTCPCCKRSFTNLRKHMASKHPEIKN